MAFKHTGLGRLIQEVNTEIKQNNHKKNNNCIGLLRRSTPGQLQLLGEIKKEKNQKSGLPRRTTGPIKSNDFRMIVLMPEDTSGAFQITRVEVDTWPRGWCFPAL